VDASYAILVSQVVRDYLPNSVVEFCFIQFEKQPLRLPDKFWPEKEYFAQHRERKFQAQS
jgi:hypothetical protein